MATEGDKSYPGSWTPGDTFGGGGDTGGGDNSSDNGNSGDSGSEDTSAEQKAREEFKRRVGRDPKPQELKKELKKQKGNGGADSGDGAEPESKPKAKSAEQKAKEKFKRRVGRDPKPQELQNILRGSVLEEPPGGRGGRGRPRDVLDRRDKTKREIIPSPLSRKAREFYAKKGRVPTLKELKEFKGVQREEKRKGKVVLRVDEKRGGIILQGVNREAIKYTSREPAYKSTIRLEILEYKKERAQEAADISKTLLKATAETGLVFGGGAIFGAGLRGLARVSAPFARGVSIGAGTIAGGIQAVETGKLLKEGKHEKAAEQLALFGIGGFGVASGYRYAGTFLKGPVKATYLDKPLEEKFKLMRVPTKGKRTLEGIYYKPPKSKALPKPKPTQKPGALRWEEGILYEGKKPLVDIKPKPAVKYKEIRTATGQVVLLKDPVVSKKPIVLKKHRFTILDQPKGLKLKKLELVVKQKAKVRQVTQLKERPKATKTTVGQKARQKLKTRTEISLLPTSVISEREKRKQATSPAIGLVTGTKEQTKRRVGQVGVPKIEDVSRIKQREAVDTTIEPSKPYTPSTTGGIILRKKPRPPPPRKPPPLSTSKNHLPRPKKQKTKPKPSLTLHLGKSQRAARAVTRGFEYWLYFPGSGWVPGHHRPFKTRQESLRVGAVVSLKTRAAKFRIMVQKNVTAYEAIRQRLPALKVVLKKFVKQGNVYVRKESKAKDRHSGSGFGIVAIKSKKAKGGLVLKNKMKMVLGGKR